MINCLSLSAHVPAYICFDLYRWYVLTSFALINQIRCALNSRTVSRIQREHMSHANLFPQCRKLFTNMSYLRESKNIMVEMERRAPCTGFFVAENSAIVFLNIHLCRDYEFFAGSFLLGDCMRKGVGIWDRLQCMMLPLG